jgi:predicted anti-sigma-YlaC factor YlaD
MTGCEPMRDAISAMVDGEEPGVDPRLVEAHLRSCAACRQFRTVAENTRRISSVTVAPEMPDMSRRVTRLVALADRASSWSLARAVLAVVAIQILVFSIPDLFATDANGGNAHDSRHLGAFTIAYAVALLVVVVRPARARSVLPIASVLAGALVITAIVDLVNGNVPFLNETLHVPEILSVVLVWVLATPTRKRPNRHTQPAPPHLTVVDEAPRRAG